MKLLSLVRHAKSSWKDPDLSDFDRPLNKRGERDAPRMGRRFASVEPPPDLLLASPARRAARTAQVIAEARVLPARLRVADQGEQLHAGVRMLRIVG